MDVTADAVLVGSVAKGTWLAGNADIDILIKFPLETTSEYLKEYGLKIGHKCIQKDGRQFRRTLCITSICNWIH